MRFWYPLDDEPQRTSVMASIVFGIVVGLSTAAVADVVDILFGCNDPSLNIMAFAYPQFLGMFGAMPALLGAVGSAALDGWLAERIGLRAGRIVMFLVIALVSVAFMVTGIEGKQTC